MTAGTPIATAATSSSRSAIHARPSRELRRAKLTPSATATSASAIQYQGLSSSDVKGSRNGRSILSTGVMPWRPAVSGWPAIFSASPLIAMRPMISPKASVTIAM